MASPARRLPSNHPGPLYVDDSCIDCGACRWIAPGAFNAHGGASRVYQQPGRDQLPAALRALVSCPTASIGHELAKEIGISRVARGFPAPFALEGRACTGVSHCGFHSRSSFGATSWLIDGTTLGRVMVDSPRFAGPLVRSLEASGGVQQLFLTHRDDVADHARFAARFSCARTLHEADLRPQTAGVEHRVRGREPLPLSGASDLLILPTPGHTEGSACLLFEERVLFTGDTLAWSPTREHLIAFRGACWYSWEELVSSVDQLRGHRFEWVLPGHGAPCWLSAASMRRSLERCLRWMESVA